MNAALQNSFVNEYWEISPDLGHPCSSNQNVTSWPVGQKTPPDELNEWSFYFKILPIISLMNETF